MFTSTLHQQALTDAQVSLGERGTPRTCVTNTVCIVALGCFTMMTLTVANVPQLSSISSYWPLFLTGGIVSCCLSSAISCKEGLDVSYRINDEMGIIAQRKLAVEGRNPIRLYSATANINGIKWEAFRKSKPDVAMTIPEGLREGEIEALFALDTEKDCLTGTTTRKALYQTKVSHMQQAVDGGHSLATVVLPQGQSEAYRSICAEILKLLRICSGFMQELVEREPLSPYKAQFFTELSEAMRDCEPTVHRFLMLQLPKLQALARGEQLFSNVVQATQEEVARLILAYKEETAQIIDSPDHGGMILQATWHGRSYFGIRLGDYLGMPAIDDPFIPSHWYWESRTAAINRFQSGCSKESLLDFCNQEVASGRAPHKSLDGTHFYLAYLRTKGVEVDETYYDATGAANRKALECVLKLEGIII